MAAQIPSVHADKVLQAKLVLAGRVIMGSDVPPGYAAPAMGGFHVSLNYSTIADAKRKFESLSDGGNIMMQLDKSFWAAAFGMLTDKFGVPWMIGCEKESKSGCLRRAEHARALTPGTLLPEPVIGDLSAELKHQPSELIGLCPGNLTAIGRLRSVSSAFPFSLACPIPGMQNGLGST